MRDGTEGDGVEGMWAEGDGMDGKRGTGRHVHHLNEERTAEVQQNLTATMQNAIARAR